MGQGRQLVLAHHVAENQPMLVAVRQFAAEVTRRTQGDLEIVLTQGGALSKLPEQLHHVLHGDVDMVIPPHDRFTSYSRKFACISLPFVFDDYAHADRVLDGEFRDWIVPDLNDMGLIFLGNWEWGFRQLTNSRRPILKPEDLGGLKIRVPPILQYRAAIQAMGGNAIPIEFDDLVRAIRQGLVDGEENPVSVIHALKLYESQTYLTVLNYAYCSSAHVISKKSYASLTPIQQQILGEESRKAGLLARSLMRLHEEEQLAELEQLGMRVDRPERAAFKAAAEPAYKVLRKAFGADVVNPFLEMVARARG